MIATLDARNAFRMRPVGIIERKTNYPDRDFGFFSVLPVQRTSEQANYFESSTQWIN